MTVRRLFAIGFIFLMTAVAWFILGGNLLIRSYVKDKLAARVEERWGRPQVQHVPSIQNAAGNDLESDASDIKVGLSLDYRRMGLLWYATYTVVFDGEYEIRNPTEATVEYVVTFEPPTPRGASTRDAEGSPEGTGQLRLDEFVFEEMGGPQKTSGDTRLALSVPPGTSKKFHVHYKSQGMDDWTYSLGSSLRHVRDFKLAATTNFKDVDFTTLSPTEPKKETADGWELTWKYTSTRARGLNITIDMPERQNPGDLAARISFFAPVSLLFFLMVMIVICVMKKVEIHPMNYFFVAAAFFAFHLLLSYLVDHIDVEVAFMISAIVSVFLVVSYLRLVTGAKFALVHAGTSQLIFLVGFSYAFFYEGFTGLAVTIGAILTLFVLMQVTGRVKWTEVLKPRSRSRVEPLPPQALARSPEIPEDLPRTGPCSPA
jgi:hypothetical protein